MRLILILVIFLTLTSHLDSAYTCNDNLIKDESLEKSLEAIFSDVENDWKKIQWKYRYSKHDGYWTVKAKCLLINWAKKSSKNETDCSRCFNKLVNEANINCKAADGGRISNTDCLLRWESFKFYSIY